MEYGLDFKNINGEVITEAACQNKASRDRIADLWLNGDDHPIFPETAV